MSRIVSKADFARLAKVRPSAVSNMVKRGTIPSSDGGIDLSDPSVEEYLAAKGINVSIDVDTTRNPPPNHPRPPRPPKKRPSHRDDDEEEYQVLEDKERLARRKLAEQVRDLELKNALKEGRLVAREVMVAGVWNPLETFLTRILSDGAKTIASTVHPLAMSGGTREEIEVAVRSELTSFIVPLKESIQEALKI